MSKVFFFSAVLYLLSMKKRSDLQSVQDKFLTPEERLLKAIYPEGSEELSALRKKAELREEEEKKHVSEREARRYKPVPSIVLPKIKRYNPKNLPDPKAAQSLYWLVESLRQRQHIDLRRSVTRGRDLYLDAEQTAQDLADRYKVTVRIVDTLEAYYSPETYRRIIHHNEYTICAEDPFSTATEAEAILKFQLARVSLDQSPNKTIVKDQRTRNLELLEQAHSKWSELADQKATDIGAKIRELKDQYCNTHGGKEASLNKLASILNKHNVKTPSGKSTWHAETVKRVLQRIDSQQEK